MKFEEDIYPGKPKILFIGWPNSSHTHSWIELFEGGEFNVRLFGLPSLPPDDWKVRTYLTEHHPSPDPGTRKFVHKGVHRYLRGLAKLVPSFPYKRSDDDALAEVMRKWQPDIIHTLGFDPASYFYCRVRHSHQLEGVGRWVAQARGGPDLYLYRHDPGLLKNMKQVVAECDYFIADNLWNYDFAQSLGLSEEKMTPLGIVSGTGGMDVDGLRSRWTELPSKRERVIYMPKAYENQAVKGLAAMEGLRMAWPHIQPCKVVFAWVVQPEMEQWIHACLGDEILEHCEIKPLIPREESLGHTLSARVLYAPSVLDGVPNSMLEAMACGAFPIISPLEGVDGVVENERNVLFARNLYPEELAEALIRAMSDDDLVDAAANRNVERVRTLSDRKTIKPVAHDFYKSVAGRLGD